MYITDYLIIPNDNVKVQLCSNRLKEFVQVHRALNKLSLILRPGTLVIELSP